MITWTSLLAVACVGVSLANAAAVWVAWDRVAFPHAMLSDYAAADARVVNSAWPVYIVCHAAVEWRLLKHVRSAPESRLKSAWVLSWYFLVLGWASMARRRVVGSPDRRGGGRRGRVPGFGRPFSDVLGPVRSESRGKQGEAAVAPRGRERMVRGRVMACVSSRRLSARRLSARRGSGFARTDAKGKGHRGGAAAATRMVRGR